MDHIIIHIFRQHVGFHWKFHPTIEIVLIFVYCLLWANARMHLMAFPLRDDFISINFILFRIRISEDCPVFQHISIPFRPIHPNYNTHTTLTGSALPYRQKTGTHINNKAHSSSFNLIENFRSVVNLCILIHLLLLYTEREGEREQAEHFINHKIRWRFGTWVYVFSTAKWCCVQQTAADMTLALSHSDCVIFIIV